MPKGVVEYIVKSIVDSPQLVSVAQRSEDSRVILEIHVDQRDRGKVIGKGGKTIRSIRAIASLVSPETDLFVDVAK